MFLYTGIDLFNLFILLQNWSNLYLCYILDVIGKIVAYHPMAKLKNEAKEGKMTKKMILYLKDLEHVLFSTYYCYLLGFVNGKVCD